MENSNCTFHIVENIKSNFHIVKIAGFLPHCWCFVIIIFAFHIRNGFFYLTYFANCGTWIILLLLLWKFLNHSFRILGSLHCNFNNVENLNCTYVPHLGKYHEMLSTLKKLLTFLPINYLNFLTLEHIVNHFFHISSIEPIDLWGLPQILQQSTKFLPRACLRSSR